jgi:hypothetical protein
MALQRVSTAAFIPATNFPLVSSQTQAQARSGTRACCTCLSRWHVCPAGHCVCRAVCIQASLDVAGARPDAFNWPQHRPLWLVLTSPHSSLTLRPLCTPGQEVLGSKLRMPCLACPQSLHPTMQDNALSGLPTESVTNKATMYSI